MKKLFLIVIFSTLFTNSNGESMDKIWDQLNDTTWETDNGWSGYSFLKTVMIQFPWTHS
jgi:midasin (ATPase involved in ribosome maturation)